MRILLNLKIVLGAINLSEIKIYGKYDFYTLNIKIFSFYPFYFFIF